MCDVVTAQSHTTQTLKIEDYVPTLKFSRAQNTIFFESSSAAASQGRHGEEKASLLKNLGQCSLAARNNSAKKKQFIPESFKESVTVFCILLVEKWLINHPNDYKAIIPRK